MYQLSIFCRLRDRIIADKSITCLGQFILYWNSTLPALLPGFQLFRTENGAYGFVACICGEGTARNNYHLTALFGTHHWFISKKQYNNSFTLIPVSSNCVKLITHFEQGRIWLQWKKSAEKFKIFLPDVLLFFMDQCIIIYGKKQIFP